MLRCSVAPSSAFIAAIRPKPFRLTPPSETGAHCGGVPSCTIVDSRQQIRRRWQAWLPCRRWWRAVNNGFVRTPARSLSLSRSKLPQAAPHRLWQPCFRGFDNRSGFSLHKRTWFMGATNSSFCRSAGCFCPELGVRRPPPSSADATHQSVSGRGSRCPTSANVFSAEWSWKAERHFREEMRCKRR